MDIDIETLISTEDKVGKDAIHVPIIPIVAKVTLYPGQRITLTGEMNEQGCYYAEPWLHPHGGFGIVSPFLMHPVLTLDQCWALVLPGSVNKLRHEWEHPNLPEKKMVSVQEIAIEDDDYGCRNCY
jgi:hypothetical protein